MKKAVLALKLAENIPQVPGCDYFGADAGVLALMREKLPCTCAIGDFDSVSDDAFKDIVNYAQKVIHLNPVKDDTDAEAAVRWILEQGYDAVDVYGAFGGRVDHTIMNLRLAMVFPGKVRMLDQQNCACAYERGSYSLIKGDYSYLSLFVQEDAMVSLAGVKYPLMKRVLHATDLYTSSNEILEKAATLEVTAGRVLVLQTRD